MQMPIPTEIFWLLLLLGAAAAAMVWSGRDNWRSEGTVQLWILIEDFAGYFLFMGMFVTSTLQITIRYGLSDMITLVAS